MFERPGRLSDGQSEEGGRWLIESVCQIRMEMLKSKRAELDRMNFVVNLAPLISSTICLLELTSVVILFIVFEVFGFVEQTK